MRAVVITRPGGPEVLEVREVPTPEPLGDQVRVRVRACGLNRADLLQARGHYPAPPGVPADVPGLEYAGEIDALGPGVTGPLRVGDRVFGIVGGGGLASSVVTHERMAVPIPPQLSFEQAAAVPEVFLTAHDALEAQAGLRPGESVLIHAVGSGVGTAALQLALAAGCRVFGTSRTPEKLASARALGLAHPIETGRDDFVAAVLDATGGEGVSVTLDLLGGPLLDRNLDALAVRGRLIVIGLLAGASGPLDLGKLLRKRLRVIGTALRSRPLEEKVAASRAFAERVVPLLASGRVVPVLDRVYPLERVAEAGARLESNLGFGKVVLTV